jgi:hypothetical protein
MWKAWNNLSWARFTNTFTRRTEWFEVMDAMHFVMWWVPAGNRPTLQDGLARLDHLREKGDSAHAFGWAHLKQATRWRSDGCQSTASE